MTLTIGIDDAGRGPVIGSMVLAGVLLEKPQETILKKLGISDSKKLYQSTRKRMAREIKENSVDHKIVKTSANEIDKSLTSGTNLNTLEAIKTADVINALNRKTKQIRVIIDCPSINIPAWKNTLMKYIKHPSNLIIRCEHKADANHLSAAAGSILAKVTRESEMQELRKKYKEYGDMGSGYPSDPKTKLFLKEHGKALQDSGLFRKTWSTWKKLYPKKDTKQKSLLEF
jgi:ribonuclease HII